MGVRWDVASPLRSRHGAALRAERGVDVDHATIQRWVVTDSPPVGSGMPPPEAASGRQLADGRDWHINGDRASGAFSIARWTHTARRWTFGAPRHATRERRHAS